MKKIMNKINFAIIAIMTSVPAFADDPKFTLEITDEMCKLLKKMQGVFNVLRAAAFIGAAFFIAGWAWTYISKAGDSKGGFTIEDAKTKGIGLLVGFALSFLIGFIISFVMATAGVDGAQCLKEGW